MQQEDNIFRQFCNPILDLDNITRSSAYKSEFNFAPFGKTKGSDKVSSKENGILLIKRLNSNGLKMQPCITAQLSNFK